MALNHKYKIIIEDETTLEKKLNFSGRIIILVTLCIAIFIISAGIGILLLAVTPLKTSLPGYLKASERAATEEQHMRLDSILQAFEIQQAYFDNILEVLNPIEPDTTIFLARTATTPLSLDSILPVSDIEKDFVENIRERDKYNIQFSSPAAAESLMFESINPEAVISEASLDSYIADFILPLGGSVYAVADGKVISISNNPRFNGSYEVIIQHPNGFLSKSSRLGKVIVTDGERVSGGQIIAEPNVYSSNKSNIVSFELWHDGTKLIPARYLNNENK